MHHETVIDNPGDVFPDRRRNRSVSAWASPYGALEPDTVHLDVGETVLDEPDDVEPVLDDARAVGPDENPAYDLSGVPQEAISDAVRTCHESWIDQLSEAVDSAPDSQPEVCSNCFAKQAAIAQELKRVMVTRMDWSTLKAPQREALEIVTHRMSAILNGGGMEKAHWRAIADYARSVERWLTVAPEGCPACNVKMPERTML